MPKRKTTATPAQTAAAAAARAIREIPTGMIAVQSTVWLPAKLVEVWKGQKPGDRGDAWRLGMEKLELERSEFPWDELEMLRGYLKTVKNILGG